MAVPAIRSCYSLRFEEDGIGLPKRVEFEAASASLALEIAEQECHGRSALLVCEGKAICQVSHHAGAWRITPVPPTPT